MPTTSRALLSEIIDYAGLFPPARLPMDEAFSRFLAHRSSAHGWLLARFVCPAARLDELTPLIESAHLGQTPIRIAVLGTGGDDPPGFSEAIENDTGAMKVFSERFHTEALIDVFEVKLPAHGDPSEVVDVSFDHLVAVSARPPTPFFETSILGDSDVRVATVAAAVAAASHEIADTRRAGLKVRCGGLDAAAVPTIDAVAKAIIASRNHGLPLKATQGLHHPVRHHDAALNTEIHGFLNVFAAAILAEEHALDEATVREIVAEEDSKAFDLTDSVLRWRDLEIGFESVADGRMTTMTSFGSCSFSEPRDDLAELGWL